MMKFTNTLLVSVDMTLSPQQFPDYNILYLF